VDVAFADRTATKKGTATKKASSATKTARTKQDASVEGGRNAGGRDFKIEVGGTAQSFRDQD
jgi:hypothetical protein